MEMETQALELLNSNEKDLKWFNSNYNELVKIFSEQFVAIKNEKVIKHNPNFRNIINELERSNINTREVLIQFVSKIKVIL